MFEIVGDYMVIGKKTPCLILLCNDEEIAKQELKKLIANPPKECLGNIHIEVNNDKNAWYLQNLD